MAALSANSGFCVPRTTIAFRFLEAMTRPRPVRPKARLLMFMIDAKRTPFSPDAPIWITSAFGSPTSALIFFSISPVLRSVPHKCAASRSSA